MIDFIIVGQGIAGSVLGKTLLNKKKKVLFIDKSIDYSASNAAAGIFNPITGRIMRKTWMANELFSFLPKFYQDFEQDLHGKFFYAKKLIRVFNSQKQLNDWHLQMESPSFSSFVDSDFDQIPIEINAELGSYALNKSGYVDVPALISSFRKYLIQNKLIIEEEFQHEALSFKENAEGEYKGIKFKRIIFCEGIGVKSNPFFNFLPIVPNKGEMLEVTIPRLNNNYIYNKSGFLLPRGKDTFWVGSTYIRDELEKGVSNKSMTELIDKIKGLTDLSIEIQKSISGFRPTTKDRRPIMGVHPKFEQIAIFNGLGSKGVSLAPYWSEHFSNHLLEDEKLDSEVNITRFYSLL